MPGWKALTAPEFKTWEKANDPSPAGWRVPTQAEIEKLFDLKKVERTWDAERFGVTFTDKANGNSIFLPAAGFRWGSNGKLDGVNRIGDYYSSTEKNNGAFYTFRIAETRPGTPPAWMDDSSKQNITGMFIRPVAE